MNKKNVSIAGEKWKISSFICPWSKVVVAMPRHNSIVNKSYLLCCAPWIVIQIRALSTFASFNEEESLKRSERFSDRTFFKVEDGLLWTIQQWLTIWTKSLNINFFLIIVLKRNLELSDETGKIQESCFGYATKSWFIHHDTYEWLQVITSDKSSTPAINVKSWI